MERTFVTAALGLLPAAFVMGWSMRIPASPSEQSPMAAVAIAPALISAGSSFFRAASIGHIGNAPAAPVLSTPIERQRDGLFYLDAQVNGRPIHFLVDTGATTVILRPEDARWIGAAMETRSNQPVMKTASGSAPIQWAKLDRMTIGDQEFRNIDAVVAGGGLPVSLLGQNALAQFQSIMIEGHRLHLK